MIVVTAATGHIGRQLVEQLLAEGVTEIRAVTRSPERARLPAGIEVVKGELAPGREGELTALCRGAQSLYLNLAATSGASNRALVDAAVAAEVRRIVLNSSVSVLYGEEGGLIARSHLDAENAIRDSGLEWCFVRGGMYATNALNWAREIRAGGVVHGAHAQAVGAPVHEADIAAVTARALLDEKGAQVGRAHVLTGPAAVTFAEQAAEIGRAIGRPEVRFQEIPEDEAVAAMTAGGVPEPLAREIVGYFGRTIGEQPLITDEVAQVTGRPARTFAEWARDHRADFS